MPSHKFKIGETVMLKPSVSRNVPGGVYEVTKQLPHNGREFEYRIKSAGESHERVAQESELTRHRAGSAVEHASGSSSAPVAPPRNPDSSA